MSDQPNTEPTADRTDPAEVDAPEPQPDLEPEATEDQTEPDATEPDATTEAKPDDAVGKLRSEAAKYRTRLRETEDARDQLADQLANFQRERIAELATGPGMLHDGHDLFRDPTTDLAALVNEDGTLNVEQVRAQVDTVRSSHPHWGSTAEQVARRPAEKLKAGATHSTDTERSWSDVLRGAAR